MREVSFSARTETGHHLQSIVGRVVWWFAQFNTDRVEAVYWRSDLYGRRRELLQDWSDSLTTSA